MFTRNKMEKYEILKKLGVGGFGSVYLATRKKDGEKVAIKIIQAKKVKWLNKRPAEVVILALLENVEGVTKMLDYFKYSNCLCVVMDLCEGQDLFDYINGKGPLAIDETKFIIKRLVEILIDLEKKNIYHNDIKDENIMISEDGETITLIDFGLATTDGNKPCTAFRGTVTFAPPEWFVDKEFSPKYATIWAIGVLMIVMLSGNLPFASGAEVMRGKYSLPATITEPIQTLVEKCLAKNPHDRPSLQELHQEISQTS
jgi:serine/threonine protein kinase